MLYGRDKIVSLSLKKIGVVGLGETPEQEMKDEGYDIYNSYLVELQSRDDMKFMNTTAEYTILLNKNHFTEILPSRDLPSDFFRIKRNTVKIMEEVLATTSCQNDIFCLLEGSEQVPGVDFFYNQETKQATTIDNLPVGTKLSFLYPSSLNIGYSYKRFVTGGATYDLTPYPYLGTTQDEILCLIEGSDQVPGVNFTYNDTNKRITLDSSVPVGTKVTFFYPLKATKYRFKRFVTGGDTFTLSPDPGIGTTQKNILCLIEGSDQVPGTHYTYNDTTKQVTLSAAVPVGTKVTFFYPLTAGANYSFIRFTTGGTIYPFTVPNSHFISRNQSLVDVVGHSEFFSEDQTAERQSKPTKIYFQSTHDSYLIHLWPEVLEIQASRNIYLTFTYEKTIPTLATDAGSSLVTASIPDALTKNHIDELSLRLAPFYGLPVERQRQLKIDAVDSNRKNVIGNQRNVGARIKVKIW